MGSHSVTCHLKEVRIPPLPAAEAVTQFSDSGGMQCWVELCYVKATGQELNPWPVNRKSNALLLSHHATHKTRFTHKFYSRINTVWYSLVLNETATATQTQTVQWTQYSMLHIFLPKITIKSDNACLSKGAHTLTRIWTWINSCQFTHKSDKT